jgi:hypothetical protein
VPYFSHEFAVVLISRRKQTMRSIIKVRELVREEFGIMGSITKAENTLPGKPKYELRVGNMLIASRNTPYSALVAAKANLWDQQVYYGANLKDVL